MVAAHHLAGLRVLSPIRTEGETEDHVKPTLSRRPSSTTLLARLIEAPDLVRTVRELPAQAFSALVRHVGVEDAGEIVALATTEQIVAAFDEDLFANKRPGEREVFDADRFAVWLEVLLEAGDDVAVRRVAELSQDFVVRALSSLILVLDQDALRRQMSEGSEAAAYADKAIESSHWEEIEGYLLVSKKSAGWDATLALVLAMDRDDRALLVRILDRCAAIAKEQTSDLDALTTVLTSEEAIAEDVEAEREERRSKLGYVEPRAAQGFLALARMPLPSDVASAQRDPITVAHFRDMEPRPSEVAQAGQGSAGLQALLGSVAGLEPTALTLPPKAGGESAVSDAATPFIEAMQLLNDGEPERYGERMEELAYLANVLVVGAKTARRRFRHAEAAEAVLVTVAFGAERVAYERRPGRSPSVVRATAAELCEVLRVCTADLLFRKASSTLAARDPANESAAFLRSRAELDAAIAQLGDQRPNVSRPRASARKPSSTRRGRRA